MTRSTGTGLSNPLVLPEKKTVDSVLVEVFQLQ